MNVWSVSPFIKQSVLVMGLESLFFCSYFLMLLWIFNPFLPALAGGWRVSSQRPACSCSPAKWAILIWICSGWGKCWNVIFPRLVYQKWLSAALLSQLCSESAHSWQVEAMLLLPGQALGLPISACLEGEVELTSFWGPLWGEGRFTPHIRLPWIKKSEKKHTIGLQH